MMNALDIINRYYPPGGLAHDVLMRHSVRVADAAVRIAERVSHLQPDVGFIREAAMLHDIGICFTRSPEIGCQGEHPYISHGYLGRELLEQNGFSDKFARVCERHVGVGLTAREIEAWRLPLPVRDMLPVTVEEQIICFADKFYSKMPPPFGTRHDTAQVIASLEKYGRDKVERFTAWLDLFAEPGSSGDGDRKPVRSDHACGSRT